MSRSNSKQDESGILYILDLLYVFVQPFTKVEYLNRKVVPYVVMEEVLWLPFPPLFHLNKCKGGDEKKNILKEIKVYKGGNNHYLKEITFMALQLMRERIILMFWIRLKL